MLYPLILVPAILALQANCTHTACNSLEIEMRRRTESLRSRRRSGLDERVDERGVGDGGRASVYLRLTSMVVGSGSGYGAHNNPWSFIAV